MNLGFLHRIYQADSTKSLHFFFLKGHQIPD